MNNASSPAETPANLQTADAATAPQTPVVIYREDYQAPAWLVPEIALNFELSLEATHITSTLRVNRNPEEIGRAHV